MCIDPTKQLNAWWHKLFCQTEHSNNKHGKQSHTHTHDEQMVEILTSKADGNGVTDDAATFVLCHALISAVAIARCAIRVV